MAITSASLTLVPVALVPVSRIRPSLARLAGAALLLGCAVAPAEVLAQAAAAAPLPPSDVQAVDYAPIPAGARFEVQTDDDSDLTQDAITRVQAELVNRGYVIESGAPLVMVVETDLVRSERQDDPLGQMHVTNDEGEVQARLFSTNQNSLLNPRRPIGTADRTFRISLAVYDRASGLYVWRGSATRSDPDIEVRQAGNEMVAALIGTVGKSMNAPVEAAE